MAKTTSQETETSWITRRLWPALMIVLVAGVGFRMVDIIRVMTHENESMMPTAVAETAESEPEEIQIAQADDDTMMAEDADSDGTAASDDVDVLASDPLLEDTMSAQDVELLQDLVARREAIEARERAVLEQERILSVTEAQIERKIKNLRELKAEIEKLVVVQNEQEKERLSKLVNIYRSMKPKDAATIFNEMELSVLIPLIDMLPDRKSAEIMAAMEPDKARTVSSELARQRGLKVPAAAQ